MARWPSRARGHGGGTLHRLALACAAESAWSWRQCGTCTEATVVGTARARCGASVRACGYAACAVLWVMVAARHSKASEVRCVTVRVVRVVKAGVSSSCGDGPVVRVLSLQPGCCRAVLVVVLLVVPLLRWWCCC